MPPDDPSWLHLLPRLVASRGLREFWCQAQVLLNAIAPHRTAVAWCDLQFAVLGEEATSRRDLALRALRTQLDTLATSRERRLTDEFLAFLADSSMAGPAVLAGRWPAPAAVTCELVLQELHQPGAPLNACVLAQGWERALLLPLLIADGEPRAGLMLYRTSAEGPFSKDQIAAIEALRSTLASLLDRLLEERGRRDAQADIHDFLGELPVGLMLFDWEWGPLFINAEGYRQAQIWNFAPAIPPPGEARLNFRIPTELRAAGDRLRSLWVGDAIGNMPLHGALEERVRHPLGRDMQATVTMAPARGDPLRPPGLLVRFAGMTTRADAHFQPSDAQLSVLAQLTPGERNVTLLLMRGMSNQEIALALHRDISTVKDHLSHVYDKLGIRGRAQLMARLNG